MINATRRYLCVKATSCEVVFQPKAEQTCQAKIA
jgi:hypothetical protein